MSDTFVNVKDGWASYSYKPDPNDPKGCVYTPDAVFGDKKEADWFGAFRSSGRVGFPHPVRWVEVGGRAYILSEEPAAIGLDRFGERPAAVTVHA